MLMAMSPDTTGPRQEVPTASVKHLTYGNITGLAGDRGIFGHMLDGRTIWERHIVERMFEFVTPGSIVIDAGANIGLHTLFFARWTGAAGRVYAFEPQPVVGAILQKNLADNGLTNVTVLPSCLVAPGSPPTLRFPDVDYSKTENPGAVGLAGLTETMRTIDVPATTLDDFYASRKDEIAGRPLSFVKIDVEGAEADVLAGAENLIRTERPNLIIEIMGGLARDDGHQDVVDSVTKIHERLREIGYRTIEQIDDHNYLCQFREIPLKTVVDRDFCILNESHERKVFSQNGEDGIIETIFECLGTTNRYFVEIGCEDGSECNTRLLSDRGWEGVRIDGNNHRPEKSIHQSFVTLENIVDTLRRLNVPREFDFLSIDIDGNDFYVWNAIAREFKPRIVCIEFNASLPSDAALVIPYRSDFVWDGTDYFGSSLGALRHVAARYGYHLLYIESFGVNVFFVHNDEVQSPGGLGLIDARSLFRRPKYGGYTRSGLGGGHPADPLDRPYASYEEAVKQLESALIGRPTCDDEPDDPAALTE